MKRVDPGSRGLWLAVAVAALTVAGTASAAEVPAQNQAAMLFRILPYDRNLGSRAGDGVHIAVLYKEGDGDSTSVQRDILEAVNRFATKSKVGKLPADAVALPYSSGAKLAEDLRRLAISAVYVCPGLTESLGAILQATRGQGALTFAASEAYVRSGVSVGVVRRGEKAAILVNLASSRAERADLDSAFLGLAEVIR